MKLLKDLIEIDTYSGDYTEMITCLSNYLTKNLDCEVYLQNIDDKKANIIAKMGEPELVLNCHMDTVPPSKNWKYDSLKLTKVGSKLYGLGTTDTKGNIYTYIKAVEKVRPKNIMLLFSVDEEKGIKTGVKYFLESKYKQGIKRAIVGEPTNTQFISKHKGYYSFDVETYSKDGHSSNKQKGAIVKAADSITKLHDLGFSIGLINGGTAGNVISQICKYRTSKRTYDSHGKTTEFLNSALVDSEVISRFVGPPLINEVPKFEGEFEEVSFWTEAALFQEVGINSIVFGAGTIDNAHTVDEFIEESQLIKAQKILEKLIEGL